MSARTRRPRGRFAVAAVIAVVALGVVVHDTARAERPERAGAVRATWDLIVTFFGPPPCVPGPYPVLGDAGFVGFDHATPGADARASLAALFPCAVIRPRRPAPQFQILTADGAPLADVGVYGGDGAALNRVSLDAPGITTVHGLSVGQPLAAVLGVRARRVCELGWGGSESGGTTFVRCWVGDKPAHFRYVAFLPEQVFGGAPPAPLPKLRTSRQIEAWLPSSGLTIDLILWHLTPDPQAAP